MNTTPRAVQDRKREGWMTREDAKHIIDVAFSVPQAVRRSGEDRTYHEDEIREAKEMAIRALSQESCEDTINRILKRMWNCRGKHTTSIDKVKMEQIIREDLPSVTPEQKMGRWIYTGDYITDGMLRCSECGFEHDVSERFLYCPECGVKMAESEESNG